MGQVGRPKRITSLTKYRPGFLENIDARTHLYELLHTAHNEVLNDCGGKEQLSHVKLCLIERFVFLEHTLRRIEREIAVKDIIKSTEQLSRWIQALNSIIGLAKTIGLERRGKKVVNLKTYIKEISA